MSGKRRLYSSGPYLDYLKNILWSPDHFHRAIFTKIRHVSICYVRLQCFSVEHLDICNSLSLHMWHKKKQEWCLVFCVWIHSLYSSSLCPLNRLNQGINAAPEAPTQRFITLLSKPLLLNQNHRAVDTTSQRKLMEPLNHAALKMSVCISRFAFFSSSQAVL